MADAAAGGYDGSGIAGGLDLDGNGVFDRSENNPDIISDDVEKHYTYDEDAYEDAEGALKDLGHALKHGDEEDRTEALEKLQGYLGGFGKGNEEDQEGTKTQDDRIPRDSEDVSDGIKDAKEDSDGDGILDWEETDSDGDGIDDGRHDYDGDGILDWDLDGDGIEDSKDPDWWKDQSYEDCIILGDETEGFGEDILEGIGGWFD